MISHLNVYLSDVACWQVRTYNSQIADHGSPHLIFATLIPVNLCTSASAYFWPSSFSLIRVPEKNRCALWHNSGWDSNIDAKPNAKYNRVRLLCTNGYSTVHDMQSKYEIVKVKTIMSLHDEKRGDKSAASQSLLVKHSCCYFCSLDLRSATITSWTRINTSISFMSCIKNAGYCSWRKTQVTIRQW